jgi:diguanylate cyclase (GGDEF)-like protein
MNLIGRQDRLLFGGLAVALIVLFAGPIRDLLDLAGDVERQSGLAFVPALVILTAVLLFHLQGKRQEAKTRAAVAEAVALDAEARAAEIERLVVFGQALGRSLDLDAIRDVVAQHLPKLAGGPDGDAAWVMIQQGGHWQPLVTPARDRRRDIEPSRAAIADRALTSDHKHGTTPAVMTEGHLCVPMAAGNHTVGVLGVPQTGEPFSDARQRTLAAAAALLGISLRNAQLFREVRETSLRDGLTGIFNRTHGMGEIDVELRRARRSQMPVSLIMFDLDHFKDVNDRYGHLCGDAVLAAVGAKMREVLRGSDLKCRYGGEEFLVLLPETALEGAKRVADTLRRELSDMPIPWKDETVFITASFGVTVSLPAEISTEAVIGRADVALYRAKDQGRNCVRLSLETAVA